MVIFIFRCRKPKHDRLLGCPQGLVTPGGGGTGNPCSAPADTPPPPPPSGPAPPHKISPPHSTPAERRRLGARQTAARQPEVRHRQGAAVSSTVASPPSPSDPPPAYPHTAAPPPLTPRIERSMFSRPTGSADSTVYPCALPRRHSFKTFPFSPPHFKVQISKILLLSPP